MSKHIQKWVDPAMFTAEPSDATDGPRVYLLAATADPLGAVAAAAKMYKGEVVRDYADVTDQERKHYLEEMKKTKLKMPLEAVNFHFLFDGVTRAFTHQLVRQRTAAYSQESLRFAVVEDSFIDRVALPPSLAGTVSLADAISKTMDDLPNATFEQAEQATLRAATQKQKWRWEWDEALVALQGAYQSMVNTGMPAEDARGLLPTNITTRVNYFTNLRGLLDHAGNRLCTQAQFEWRLVLAQVAKALREYNPGIHPGNGRTSFWQFEAIADLLRPVCYQTGKCEFGAEFDRKCKIRERVQIRAKHGGKDSEQWHKPFLYDEYDKDSRKAKIKSSDGIQTWEWLADPSAAR
jgi:flavin-dependent thymidylate synthase